MEATIYLGWYLLVGMIFNFAVTDAMREREGKAQIFALCTLFWPVIILTMIHIIFQKVFKK